MGATSQRTQIILPKALREEIEIQRRVTGESLAEYLRKAAEERLVKEKKKRTDLKKLAAQFSKFAESNRSKRTKKEIKEWEREVQEDKRLHDVRLLERLDESKSLAKVSRKGAKVFRDFAISVKDK